MANADISRKAIWWLGSVLALALLGLAFLLGRESMRFAPMVEAPDDAAEALPVEEAPSAEPPTVDSDATEEPSSIDPANRQATVRLERRPNGKIVLSNIRDEKKRAERPANKARSAVRKKADQPKSVGAYLDRMDAIRYGEEAADPNMFAMSLIKAGMSGSTEGFDKLIADTDGMEQEMKSITPPPSCNEYHEASLKALGHGRAILVELKSAIETRDISKIAAVAQEASALQTKADELSRLESNLRAARGYPKAP